MIEQEQWKLLEYSQFLCVTQNTQNAQNAKNPQNAQNPQNVCLSHKERRR